ncbi:hypothetical protein [Actinoplanes sp. N902-109]|uniref:hypothetical protein n=1 Tax=Actinoplanes sp. (strain N902-109) TaxID=649831 RepID=UPI00039CAE8E|nr:hypothetical protein [Actinoplanes sp. N902-109]
MSDRTVDRAAWADLIAELVQTHARGKNAPFARLIGRDPKTVMRWREGRNDVSEESVRAVARALDLPAAQLLVRVGYYRPDEFGPQDINPLDDDELRAIAQRDDLDEDLKMEIIEVVKSRREEDRRRRESEVAAMINLARRGQQERGTA